MLRYTCHVSHCSAGFAWQVVKVWTAFSYLPGDIWTCFWDESPIKHMGKWPMSWQGQGIQKKKVDYGNFCTHLLKSIPIWILEDDKHTSTFILTHAPCENVKRVRTCSLTQVMAESCDLHTEDVSAGDEELRLPLIESLYKLSCQVAHPETVKENPQNIHLNYYTWMNNYIYIYLSFKHCFEGIFWTKFEQITELW